MNAYDKGDLVRCSGVFTNLAGTAIDPDVVKFDFATPAGVTTTYTYGVGAQLVKSATGTYYVDLSATEVKVWSWRLYATGIGQSAAQGEFFVYDSSVLAITLGQARANLRVTETDEDDRIVSLIYAAQIEYEDYTGRILLSASQTLYLDAFADNKIRLKAPLSTITKIEYYNSSNVLTELAITQYVKHPNAEWPEIRLAYDCSWPTTYDRPGAVIITYVAGYARPNLVPETIKNGLLLYIAHHFENREPLLAGGGVVSAINPWENCWSNRVIPI